MDRAPLSPSHAIILICVQVDSLLSSFSSIATITERLAIHMSVMNILTFCYSIQIQTMRCKRTSTRRCCVSALTRSYSQDIIKQLGSGTYMACSLQNKKSREAQTTFATWLLLSLMFLLFPSSFECKMLLTEICQEFGALQTLLGAAITLLLFVCMRRRYFSPLSDIPGPFVASFSASLWHVWQVWHGHTEKSMINLHHRYGMGSRIPGDTSR